MKRFLLTALALVVSAALAVAGGGKGEVTTAGQDVQLNPPGTYPITKTPTSFSVVTIYLPLESSGKLQDTELEAYLEKLTNVKAVFKDVIDSDIAAEKINLLLASGDLPDAIITPWHINVQQAYLYGSQGSFIALDDLIRTRMPGLTKLYEANPNLKKQLVAPDGKMYAFPYLEAGCYHCTLQNKFWIYDPWLKKLGLKSPTTTEELYTVLKAFKAGDPNGNGKADEIAMSGATTGWNGNPLTFIMSAFVYTNTANYMKLEGGRVSFVANTNEWREGLKYLNRLYKEGLIAPETFIQKEDQMRAAVENPDIALVGSFPAGWYGVYTVNGGGTGRFADYQPVMPLAGPSGVRQATYSPLTVNPQTFITKFAKNPEVIASWVDWFYQEPLYEKYSLGWDFAQAGINYRLATPEEQKTLISRTGHPAVLVPLGTQKEYGKDKYDDGFTRTAPTWNAQDYWGMPPEDATDPAAIEYRLMVATRELYQPYKADKSMPPNLIFDASIQQEYVDLTTAIAGATGVVSAWSTEFITGARNVNDEAEWQRYLNELKRAGVERYEKLWSDTVKKAGY